MTAPLLRTRVLGPLVTLALIGGLTGCGPEGLINKTKYQGQTYTNTCETFTNDMTLLIDANSGPSTLHIAEEPLEGDPGAMYLEPGQFLLAGDTLYFRVANEPTWGKYLQKGVAVQIKASYRAQDHLENLESPATGDLGMLVFDEKYWKANTTTTDPAYTLFKMNVGKNLDGRQLALNFTVVKLKNGQVSKVYCETDVKPLGPLEPAAVTDRPWDPVKLRSVIAIPEVPVQDEEYRYKGFTGVLDLIFPINSTKFSREELYNAIKQYLEKYEAEGYRVNSVSLTGFCSQGGTVDLNQKLSEARAQAVSEELKKYFGTKGRADSVQMSLSGRGEDWDRFNEYANSDKFTPEERQQVMAIAQSSASLDEKEAELRKLPFWKKLIAEVLDYCRHCRAEFRFDYLPKVVTAGYYPARPFLSPELFTIATRSQSIGRYRTGDARPGLTTLNTIIDENGHKKANLYAMRSTYHMALNDFRSTGSDINTAAQLDGSNQQYAVASLAFRTQDSYTLSMSDRMRLLNTYNDYVARFPQDQALAANRAIMMDRVGFISGALPAHDKVVGQGGQSAAGFNNRGVAKLKTHRLTEAEADFQEALRRDANLAEAHFNLACVYAYRGLAAKSADAMRKAVSLKPELKSEIQSNPVFKAVRTSSAFSSLR